jgi:hypothetical protein
MWVGGVEVFCDETAYGKPPESKTFFNYAAGCRQRVDGRYDGYVPGLACFGHGGPKKEEVLNLCEFCSREFATCQSAPKFGCGRGNDNVFECGSFALKEATDEPT